MSRWFSDASGSGLAEQDPPTLLAGYLVDREVAIASAKASYDDLVGRSAFSKAAEGIISQEAGCLWRRASKAWVFCGLV